MRRAGYDQYARCYTPNDNEFRNVQQHERFPACQHETAKR
jgi:hypothetical protein